MNRTGPRPLGDRTISGLVHAMIDKVLDDPLQQAMNLIGRGKQPISDVEVLHPFGFRTYPKSKTDAGAAEVSILSLGGNQSITVALPPMDRRFGPRSLREGETVFHDAYKQYLHFMENAISLESPKRFDLRVAADQGSAQTKNQGANLAAEKKPATNITGKATGTLATTSTGATTVTGKTVGLTAGTKPETVGNHELNQQMKGIVAQLTQLKDSHHALVDLLCTLRTNVEQVVPMLAPLNLATQVTAALNGSPAGLDVMKALASGKLQDYFQNAIKSALQDFLNPARMLAAASVMSGGVEGLIAQAQAQIATLIAQNPVAAQVDGLLSRIEALADAPLAPDIAGAATAVLQAQVDLLARQNPVVGQVQQLRAQLQSLIDGAGPGLGFLAPQQRLVQGLTRSMLFSKS